MILLKAGYLEIKKEFIEEIPHTVLRLTDSSRTASDSYRLTIREVLEKHDRPDSGD